MPSVCRDVLEIFSEASDCNTIGPDWMFLAYVYRFLRNFPAGSVTLLRGSRLLARTFPQATRSSLDCHYNELISTRMLGGSVLHLLCSLTAD